MEIRPVGNTIAENKLIYTKESLKIAFVNNIHVIVALIRNKRGEMSTRKTILRTLFKHSHWADIIERNVIAHKFDLCLVTRRGTFRYKDGNQRPQKGLKVHVVLVPSRGRVLSKGVRDLKESLSVIIFPSWLFLWFSFKIHVSSTGLVFEKAKGWERASWAAARLPWRQRRVVYDHEWAAAASPERGTPPITLILFCASFSMYVWTKAAISLSIYVYEYILVYK